VVFMSAGLAHDIGHDLATVSCLTAAVRRDPALHPDSRRRLEVVEREVARLQEMVGGNEAEHAGAVEVSLPAVVAEVVEPFALVCASEVTAGPSAEVRLAVDVHALWRLLANLVGNAVSAAGPAGRVRVAVCQGPPLQIEVRDDGPGMAAPAPGCAGLGLPTSRVLASRCDADLSFSTAPGGGTVAHVRFSGSPGAAAPHRGAASRSAVVADP
jgi:signal transduction histidine kinase